MSGDTLLETATLLPTGVNSSAATLPLSASQLAARRQHLNGSVLGEFDRAVLPGIGPAGHGLRRLDFRTDHGDAEIDYAFQWSA